jgi:hypothetical protein
MLLIDRRVASLVAVIPFCDHTTPRLVAERRLAPLLDVSAGTAAALGHWFGFIPFCYHRAQVPETRLEES